MKPFCARNCLRPSLYLTSTTTAVASDTRRRFCCCSTLAHVLHDDSPPAKFRFATLLGAWPIRVGLRIALDCPLNLRPSVMRILIFSTQVQSPPVRGCLPFPCIACCSRNKAAHSIFGVIPTREPAVQQTSAQLPWSISV
jgi:hypothetical protein